MQTSVLSLVLIGLLVSTAACRKPEPGGRAQARLPQAQRPPQLHLHDGEPAWQVAAVTGPWLDPEGQPARPYSNARLMWDTQIGRAHV